MLWAYPVASSVAAKAYGIKMAYEENAEPQLVME
jgi:hypothetical protein